MKKQIALAILAAFFLQIVAASAYDYGSHYGNEHFAYDYEPYYGTSIYVSATDRDSPYDYNDRFYGYDRTCRDYACPRLARYDYYDDRDRSDVSLKNDLAYYDRDPNYLGLYYRYGYPYEFDFDSEEEALTVSALYAMRHYNEFRTENYGARTADVYSGYKEATEPVPASNWRNKPIYDSRDYPKPFISEPRYGPYIRNKVDPYVGETTGKMLDTVYDATIGPRRETYTTPYYYEPRWDPKTQTFNWRY